VLSTDYKSSAARLAPAMFARWSQENFFRYMRQSYNLDGLVDYGADIVPDATMVVNPAYRTLDGQARKKIGVLNHKIAEFGAVNLEGDIEPCNVEAFTQRKSDLQESITSCARSISKSRAIKMRSPGPWNCGRAKRSRCGSARGSFAGSLIRHPSSDDPAGAVGANAVLTDLTDAPFHSTK
jgi:hypothetical protein